MPKSLLRNRVRKFFLLSVTFSTDEYQFNYNFFHQFLHKNSIAIFFKTINHV